MLQSHHLFSNTTSCLRIQHRVKNHKQCNFISCTLLISRDLKNIPGFHYDLLCEQHTTTSYVLWRLTMHFSISIVAHNVLWKKCYLFTLFLRFTFINIGLVMWNEKKSICIKPFICVGVRFVKEIWTSVFITRSRALWQPSELQKKTSLLQNLSSMWSKWWHLHCKESFDVAASGSDILYPPVTGCKTAYRLPNTPPALRFRQCKFIKEGKTFYVIFIFSSIFMF